MTHQQHVSINSLLHVNNDPVLDDDLIRPSYAYCIYCVGLLSVLLHCVYLEVITGMFLYRHLYQARASITALPESAETKSKAVVDRGLDIGADMKTSVL